MNDRRPGRSSLGSPLPDLIAAADPTKFSRDRGIAYRDHSVQVIISLTEPGSAEALSSLIESITTEQGTELIAWVAVPNLESLASRDMVRSVHPVTDASAHDRP